MQININDCDIFFDIYESYAKGLKKPTLIVLYGADARYDYTIYVDFWSKFNDIAQVIFIDQRGCGRSGYSDSSKWNLKTWTEDIHTFCKKLGLDKPIFAGISMGGHVLCEYIKYYGDQALGFIFCDTEARFLLDDVCDLMERKGGKEIAELTRKQFTAPTSKVQKEYQVQCSPHEGRKGYLLGEIGRCIQHPEVFEHYCKTELLKFNYLKELKKVKVPTLIMAGVESPLHPPIRATEMAEEIPQGLAKTHIFKNAGTPVYNDSPKEAESIVRNFISELVKK